MRRILMAIRAGEGGAFRHVASLSQALAERGTRSPSAARSRTPTWRCR